MRSGEIGRNGQTDRAFFLGPCVPKEKEPITHLGVGEISIGKYEMLFACISRIELLVSFIEFASSPEQIPA